MQIETKNDGYYPAEYSYLNVPRACWKKQHYDALKQAQSANDCLAVAFDVITGIGKKNIGQVCGPISTGGFGSVHKNLVHFNRIIMDLTASGKPIFDQMPFEPVLHRMMAEANERREKLDILTTFYRPIFESGLIRTLHFMPSWRTSQGATWEYHEAKRLKIAIDFI